MSAPGQGGGRRRCGASATDDNAVLGWTTMADCSRIHASGYQVLSRGHHCKSRRSAVYTDDCKSLPSIPTHERRIPGILRQILSLVDISYHKMSSPATSISQSVPAVAAPSVPEASPCPPLCGLQSGCIANLTGAQYKLQKRGLACCVMPFRMED